MVGRCMVCSSSSSLGRFIIVWNEEPRLIYSCFGWYVSPSALLPLWYMADRLCSIYIVICNPASLQHLPGCCSVCNPASLQRLPGCFGVCGEIHNPASLPMIRPDSSLFTFPAKSTCQYNLPASGFMKRPLETPRWIERLSRTPPWM